MNAWQKSYQGWLSSCNGVRVTNSGTFNLLPLEMACNGTQFLQIKAPHARPFMRPAAGGGGATTENLDYYYLELRTPVDFDGTLGGSALSARVLVHMATDLQPRTGKGFHTFLLDMAPSTLQLQRRRAARRPDLHRSGRRPVVHRAVGQQLRRDDRRELRERRQRRSDLHGRQRVHRAGAHGRYVMLRDARVDRRRGHHRVGWPRWDDRDRRRGWPRRHHRQRRHHR